MPKKLPKVIVDGMSLNKCPLCGDGVNISAWNKWKLCIHCHNMIDKGLDPEKVKRIRATEKAGEVIVKESEEEPIDFSKKRPIYNFRTTFPPGVRIVTKDGLEAKYLQEVYNYYSHYGENIPAFNVLISGILQAKIDQYRNSDRLSDDEISFLERKGIKEIDIRLGDQINKTTRILEDLKDRVDSQSGNIITAKFANMLQYLHEHEQEYRGVGVCSECNSRVIFKTNFPTFKTWLLEHIEELNTRLELDETLDKKTISTYSTALKSVIEDNELAKTYVVEHIRQLEASLIEGGVSMDDSLNQGG